MKRKLVCKTTDYTDWTKDQLIKRLAQLEGAPIKHKAHRERPFDFSAYPTRHIALKLAYFGWNYNGFASQKSYKPEAGEREAMANPSVVTVEDVLFEALLKTRIIQSPRECTYSRCGRTDAGVSSVGQVVGITVRSSAKKLSEEEGPAGLEIPIIGMLNRILPSDIRILGWSEAPSSFDARFDCIGRKYKYFFHRQSVNVELMAQAAAKLIGEHDFRNFCRRDPSKNIQNYKRNIFHSQIRPVNDQFFEYEIHGSAFLYHQVRCIMAVLYMIGQELEPVEVVDYMLDTSRCTVPPQYSIASEIPLVLYECFYPEDLGLIWRIDHSEEIRLQKTLFEMWHEQTVKSMSLGLLLKPNLDLAPPRQIRHTSIMPR